MCVYVACMLLICMSAVFNIVCISYRLLLLSLPVCVQSIKACLCKIVYMFTHHFFLCSTCHFMIIMCEQTIWFLAAHSLALIGCQFSIPIKQINRVTAFSICTKILLKHWWFYSTLDILSRNHHFSLHVPAWHAYTMYIDFRGDLHLVVASILHLTYYKLLIRVDYKNNYNKNIYWVLVQVYGAVSCILAMIPTLGS